LLADSVDARRRGLAFGFHKAMDHVGAIIGALLSAWLFSLFAGNYRRVFLAAAIPGLGSLLILIFAVREEGWGGEATGGRGEKNSSPSRPVSPSRSLTITSNGIWLCCCCSRSAIPATRFCCCGRGRTASARR